tara:strand:- start:13884 stop:14750 length:867 start_codon:yes stop_codon:yes gene_type:complete
MITTQESTATTTVPTLVTSTAPTSSKKLALLIGINYKGSDGELAGCINDVANVKDVLKQVYNYQDEDIQMLTDDTTTKPNKQNICNALLTLAKQSHEKSVKEIWIHFSGHGSYEYDTSLQSNERDKRNECLVPLDYNQAGTISDNFINKVLATIQKDVRVVLVTDCCHSGTVSDLRYRYISGSKSCIENPACRVKYNANIIALSGCRDNQVSMDAYLFKKSSGAMTTALLFVLKKFKYCITCYQLLKHIRRFLKARSFKQVPQITCNQKLDHSSLFSCVNPQPFLKND